MIDLTEKEDYITKRFRPQIINFAHLDVRSFTKMHMSISQIKTDDSSLKMLHSPEIRPFLETGFISRTE